MKNNISNRSFKLLSDFADVYRFLTDNYSLDTLNSYLFPPVFEYALTHPAFNHKLAHRFRLWEDDGELVGIVCYEMDIGQCFLITDEEHTCLLNEMLAYAEKSLSLIKNGKHVLRVWVTDHELDKSAMLLEKEYTRIDSEPVNIFSYDQPFSNLELPEGYEIISLEDENDFHKINACLWKGFNHGDTPDDDIDCRMLMQSGPHFRRDLTTVIKAPNGEYACFAGMWFDEINGYAYLEPLATIPEHRRRGLATIAFTEGMKKTKALGATYCFGGAVGFYTAIGCETICYREIWEKEWIEE